MEEGAQDLVLDKFNFNITPLFKYYYPYNCKMVFKYYTHYGTTYFSNLKIIRFKFSIFPVFA